MTALVVSGSQLSDITAARAANCFVCLSVVARDDRGAKQNRAPNLTVMRLGTTLLM